MATPKYKLGPQDRHSIKQQVMVGIAATIVAVLADNHMQIVEYINTQLIPQLNSNGTVGGAMLAIVLMVGGKALMKYFTDTRYTREEMEELSKDPRPDDPK